MKNQFTLMKQIPKGTLMLLFLKGISIAAAVAYSFYNSFIAFFLLFPLVYVYVLRECQECLKKKKIQSGVQFADGLSSVSAALFAGYSVENAFKEAKKELELLYGKDCELASEFGIITKKIEMNKTVEDALEEFAKKSENEDIITFSEVFRFAKRSGGDLISIVKTAADNIRDKQNVKRDIEILVSAKRFEQKIMNIIPFAIILYLNLTMPDMLKPLYHNLFGICVMSAALICYMAAVFMSEKIADIEV